MLLLSDHIDQTELRLRQLNGFTWLALSTQYLARSLGHIQLLEMAKSWQQQPAIVIIILQLPYLSCRNADWKVRPVSCLPSLFLSPSLTLLYRVGAFAFRSLGYRYGHLMASISDSRLATRILHVLADNDVRCAICAWPFDCPLLPVSTVQCARHPPPAARWLAD